MLFWALSLRFPMPIYGKQPLKRFDVFFLLVVLVMVSLYEAVFIPLWVSMLDSVPSIVTPVREYFSSLGYVARFTVYLITADFLAYWMHRTLHGRHAWRFHSLHHSPTSLNWLSGARGGPIHVILILSPATLASSIFLFNGNYWIFVGLAVFDVIGQHFDHSNIRLPYEKQLEYVFVTPRMHFVHHHPNPKYTDSNYGFYFSIWDRMFGTFTAPETIPVEERGRLGLDYDESKLSLFFGFDRRRPLQ